MWKNINKREELASFMESVYYFHDSCVKEMKYVSGAYVNKSLSMHPINDQRILKVIIQRQFDDISAIELEFSGLKYVRLVPVDERYTCEIHGVTMFIKDDFVFWADDDYINEETVEQYDGTIICASSVRWRAMNGYIGQEEIYQARTK